MSHGKPLSYTRRKWIVHFALLIALIVSLFPGFVPGLETPTASAAANNTLCYAVADDGDRLVTINRLTGGSFQDVGPLGVTSVEAIEWSLDATILYAANGGVFGKINTTTGAFTQIGSGFGSGSGTETPAANNNGSASFNDMDGLAMDATTGIMYGSQRNGDGNVPDDVLIQINLTTGAHVPNAFGAGKDFVSINTSTINAALNDVDDIAVDPTDGQMYAVANNSGGSDRLVKVNKLTGAVTDVGLLRYGPGLTQNPVEDMEGFSFYNDGTFYGTTGTSNELFEIDTATGIVTKIGDFTSYGDYEAVGCLVAGSNTIEGTVFEDVNGNGVYNSGTDTDRSNVTVRLYRDADNNGSYETLVNTTTSAVDGTYQFDVGLTGKFQVVVDQSTLPQSPTPTLSTPASYNINFTGYGNTSSDNDFGYVTTGSIGNFVWLDIDKDGVQDANEPGLPGIVMELNNGTCTAGVNCPTQTTDADGLYSFTNLDAGTYSVRVLSNTAALGLSQTYDPDEAGVCTVCNANDASIVLANGQVYAAADFGYAGTASIGDFVWDDTNNNGAYNAGEAGLSGVAVELTWYGVNGVAGGGDDVIFTTTTNGGGGYDFTSLPAGNYSVNPDTTTAPAGYVLTTANDPLAVSVTSGQDYNNADFGLYRAPEAIKQLYFTTPGQGMDRISPVNTNDTTTAASAALIVPQTSYQVRDEFNDGKVYTGNDGSQNWVNKWFEVGDDNDPDGGKIKVVEKLDKLGYCGDGDFCVEFKTDEVANNGWSIYREVNMSNASSAVSRVFSFKYYYKLDDADAEVKAQYSCNGGSSWTTFPNGTFNQSGGEQTGTFSQTIPCASSNTRVRFISTGTKKDKTFSFDDVDITWVLPATPDTETFTQSAALVKPLTLPATGVVTVSTYLDVTDGFIDLTKPVPMTATLRHNSPATTLLSLGNPVVTPLLPPLLNDVEDRFPTKGSYTGNAGSVNWTTIWEEDLDGNDAGGGDIKVDDPSECPSAPCLSIKANAVGIGVRRQANLNGAVSAILTYDYKNLLEDTDQIVVEVSGNGGLSYTPVHVHTASSPIGEADSVTIDITPYASANTVVRYRVVVADAHKILYIDNVRITYAVNQGYYLATWTGTIPSNTTIPTGAAISTDITSAVGGSTMQVLYDSSTYPSQLNMKVSSFINVDSLGIYTAANPGGSLVTESAPGDTVYIRATVSDPFGAADITSIDLGITDIGCGSVSTTLSSPIASTASTKTFEYAWNVGSCTGDYLATVTAHEGTEGVTARKAIPHTVLVSNVNVTGTVFDDANGSQVQNGGELGTNAGTLKVNLIGASGNVSATTTVDANGLYTFTDVPTNATYELQLTTVAGTIGQPKPATTLPSNWVTTGENTDGTPDGTPNSLLALNVATTDVTGKNFGIEQLPNSDNKTAASQPNPGGTTKVTAPTLTGIDPEDGALSTGMTLTITSLATNGTLYYDNTPVTLNQVITNYDPAKLTVDPVDGAVTVSFGYAVKDAAAKSDPTPATVTMPFSVLSLSGTVFDDANGSQVQNGTEPGTNAGGLNVNLLDGSNNVVATTPVAANGTYNFPSVTPNTSYTLQLTTIAGTPGQPAPAVALPSNWVTTGENTAGTPDGTPNSLLTAVVATSNVTQKNFGIEQLPDSNPVSAASQPNPGGTIAVTVPALSGTDPEDGLLGTGMTLTITSLATNGTLYYNNTPVMLNQVITNYDPSKLTVDPVDGNVAVTFTYAVTDAAGKTDPTPATVTLPFGTLSLTGTVFNDANGSQVQNGTEPGTNAGGLNVNLLDGSNNVVATTTVDANGLYTFTSAAPNTTYTLQLTTNPGTPGQPAPAVALPSNWVTTGENTAGTPDGAPNSLLTAIVVTSNVAQKNFGIEQLPNSNPVLAPSQPNPGGTISVTVPALSGTDPEDGALSTGMTLTITSLPTNGTLYYNNTPVTLNQVITNYDPAKLKVDPVDGPVNVSFTYAVHDAAGEVDPTPANVNIPFEALQLTGTVFDDTNGSQVQNGAEVGTNAGGLNVNLLDGSNNVVATTAVNANGLYTFSNVAPNTTYTLQLTTNPGTPGQPAPPIALPSNWVTTGENTAGTSDNTPNSLLSAVVTTSNVTQKNFGIEQLPNSDDKSASAQSNPGGAVQVTVPTLSGSDPEDGSLGTGNSFKIVTLPTNGTLYYNGTPVTAGQVIANYDPTKLTVDPADGTVTVAFTYAAVDAAGKVDPSPATVTMPFVVPDYTITKTLNTPSPVRKGETISFTIRIANTGSVTLTTVPLRDTFIDGILVYVSATPAANTSASGQLDWTDLTAATANGFGRDLGVGDHFEVVVTFVGLVDTGGGETINTATVHDASYDLDGPGGNPPQPVGDKSATAGVEIINPTSVALAEASVSYTNAQARLYWQTVNESDVIGFHIYRQLNGGELVKLTDTLLQAQKPGQNDGASYDYTDSTVEASNHYRYFVQFIGMNGPAGMEAIGEMATGVQIFLPRVGR